MSISNSNGITVDGGIHNFVFGDQKTTNYIKESSDNEFFMLLAGKAARNALYDSEQRYPLPSCHPGTRAPVLDKLSRWIEGEDGTRNTSVYWLYGPAGVGKSAIAQALSEKYAASKLAAAFFFSRNDPSRDKLQPFVASIAYQLMLVDSRLRLLIIDSIRSDPNMFDTSCENQFRKLILEPFFKLDAAEGPYLVIIDGLDECVEFSSQGRLLAMIREAYTYVPATPFRLIFIVCSRPELLIRHGFAHQGFAPILSRIEINASGQSNKDITAYLFDQFASLRQKHHRFLCYNSEDGLWPAEDDIFQLARRACGQFIFAVTVIKYVDTIDDLPQDRLQTILQLRTEGIHNSPYPELDLLYRQILSACSKWAKVQPVLRLLVTPHRSAGNLSLRGKGIAWRSAWIMSLLLDLRESEIAVLLSRLHSVLYVPESDHVDIRILHTSFVEFLQDPVRSGHYYTQRLTDPEYFELVSILLLRTPSKMLAQYPPHYTLNVCQPLKELAIVACWEWADYCINVKLPNAQLLTAMDEFELHSALALGLCLHKERWGEKLEVPLDMVGYVFSRSKEPLSWAQALVDRKPVRLIKGLESFSNGFRVGFHPSSSPGCWRYGLVLSSILDVDWRYSEFREAFFEILFPEYEPDVLPQYRVPAILPAISQMEFPEDWVVIYVTRKQGTLLNKLVDSLLAGPCRGGRRERGRWSTRTVLDTRKDDVLGEPLTWKEQEDQTRKLAEDIINGTDHICGGNWSKRWDLHRLRKLLTNYRRQLGLSEDWGATMSH
ncbi:nwd2 [Moniliophthora roreri MCA 2997]|uniref:Nwd2 n=1 Tax=Moniliophthora roreri (strain MCA 2997) TaxID=1381753 RepID=V2W410_MONRO|nr:nwd2 [Moniliophthora roreri MCA 2997]